MKKYILAFMAGVLLTFTSTSVAKEVTNIGKKITAEYSVVLNGNELPVKAVGFEGTSYAPIRVIAESLGLEVGFEAGIVILEMKGEDTMPETTYRGLTAVESGSELFFSWKDYNDKFMNESFAIGYNSEQRLLFYATLESPGSNQISEKHFEFSQDEPGAVIVHKGATFINEKYYKEPAEFH